MLVVRPDGHRMLWAVSGQGLSMDLCVYLCQIRRIQHCVDLFIVDIAEVFD